MPRRAVLFLCLGLFLSAAAEWSVPTPSADEVKAALRPGHPRLFITAADWDRLRERTAGDETLRRWTRDLIDDANLLLEEPPETYRIPDGKRLLYVSRAVLDRVYTLAFAFRVTGQAEYRERLWRELDAVCAFKDWNPPHFLDTAEMTHAVAIGYDWLHDAWTPERRDRLRSSIVRLGLEPAARIDNRAWWKAARHNWNQVCNGGITVGALAVMDEAPEPAARLVAEATGTIQKAMREYAPDGACGEGPGYWHYATSYTVWFLAALQSGLGTDYGISTAPGFDRSALFPLHMTGPTGVTFNFADAKAGRCPRGPLFYWLARRFDLPLAAAHEDQTAKPHPLDLHWRTPGDPAALAALPTDIQFRKTESAAMRSTWGDPQALFVAWKAGDNRFNHSNLDIGSFVLEAHGVRWVVDPGPDDYNLPGYFGDKRWSYYRLRAEGHNTLVLNPGEGADQDPAAAATLQPLTADAHGATSSADLTPAYRKHAERVIRTVRREGAQWVEIRDEVHPKGAADLWWFAHTAARIELAAEGRSAVLREGDKHITVSLRDAPQGFRFTELPAAPLSPSPNPAGQNANHGLRKLALHARVDGPVSWTVRFTP